MTDYRSAKVHQTLVFGGNHEEVWSEVVAAVRPVIDQLWRTITE